MPVRLEFDPDSSSVTSLKTPAPLPPVPADGDQDGWFDQMPTNPSQIPDLGALAGSTDVSLPGWARPQRRPSVPGDPRPPPRRPSGDLGTPSGAASKSGPSYKLLLLVAAAFLAVGMVLGALMQERLGPRCPDPSTHHSPQ